MIAGLIVLAASLGAVAWLAHGLWRIGAVTRGVSIPARPNAALLMVDLQTVFWDHGPYTESDKARAQSVIADEIAMARAQGHAIIAVRQEWSLPATRIIARALMKGQAIAGSAGTELAAPFAGQADHELVKRVQDAFETGALDALLADLGVGQLRIVGLDYSYCVQKTALAARNRGFDVAVLGAGTLAIGPRQRVEERLRAHGVVLV